MAKTTKQPKPGDPSYEELKAKVTELEKQTAPAAIAFKVSEKGGVSAYGLGRFPVTLYYEQWKRLLDAVPALCKFIADNMGKLKMKPAA